MFDDTRQRREPQPPANRFPRTARCDEDECPDCIRTLEQEHLRDATSEGVTDDIRWLNADHFEPASDDMSVPIEGIARIRTLRLTMPCEIRHQHAPIGREQGRHSRTSEV
jgi:hypothetical protein